MARGKHKKCGVKSKPASPRKCDIVESVPNKRGRPRSHQTQSVSSCPTPEIVHQEIAPKKRGRPPRSQLTQNVSCLTPETIAQESAQKKRGRPPRSSQNQNVSFPTSEIVDQEIAPKKRGRPPRSQLTQNVSCLTPETIAQESAQKKRGRPPRSSQNQNVSFPTSEIVDQEIAPKKRGRPPRSQLTQNVSCLTPETIAQESAQKKRGRPPRSSQNQNVSFPTSEIVDQENSTEKRRGRKRKNEKENDSCVNQDFTPKDTIPKKRVRKNGINNGKKKLTEVQYVDCDLISQEDILQENLVTFFLPENDDAADDIVLDPLTSSQCVQKREIPLVKKYEIKEEDVEIVDDQTSTVNANVIKNEEPVPDPDSQWPQACVLLAIETPIPTSSAVFCNSIGPPENAAVNDNLETFDIVEDESLGPALSPSEVLASTSSADIYDSINGPFEDSAADNQLEKSEVKEADELILLNREYNTDRKTNEIDQEESERITLSQKSKTYTEKDNAEKNISLSQMCSIFSNYKLHSTGIKLLEDSVFESIYTDILQNSNNDTDKLEELKKLAYGVTLFVKIIKKDPTILSFGSCFCAAKIYVVLDSIKEMWEDVDQAECNGSFVGALSWFFNVAGAMVTRETICNYRNKKEKYSKIREISIVLEVINSNWENVHLMINNSKTMENVTTLTKIEDNAILDPEFITSDNQTPSLENCGSLSASDNTSNENCSTNLLHHPLQNDNTSRSVHLSWTVLTVSPEDSTGEGVNPSNNVESNKNHSP